MNDPMKILYKPIKTLLLICLCFSSCENKSDSEKEDGQESKTSEKQANTEANTVEFTAEQFKNAGVTLGKIQKVPLSGLIRANGLLDVPPESMVAISAPYGGFLVSTSLLQGKYVRKGEIVATMQHPDYIQLQQDYLENKSDLDVAEAEYKRQQELAKENVNAQKTLEQARSGYQKSSARVKGLEKKLEMINISTAALQKGNLQGKIHLYAPISGYVTEVLASVGAFVNPSDRMFEIVNTTHLHAELTIFEKDVSKLKIGQKVRFTLANENSQRLATIYLIGREIRQDRTVRVHAHLEKEDEQLLPGTYLTALIETGTQVTDALPSEAIVDFEGKKHIMIRSEFTTGENDTKKAGTEQVHTFKMIPIDTGVTENGYTAIILTEQTRYSSESIVIKGAYDILSKMKNSEEEE